jgi:quercetin dioxygenase-like cupin family protein
MSRTAFRAFVIALLATIATVGVAMATSGQFATPTNFARGMLEPGDRINTPFVKLQIRGDTDVFTQKIEIAPNGHTGWHSHPGPVLVTIAAGTMTLYQGDDPTCSPRTVGVGETFIDPGGGNVHIARNEGTETLVLYATYLLPAAAGPRIDVPDPGNCPF